MIVDRYRSEAARRAQMHVCLDAAMDVPVLDDPAARIDAEWRIEAMYGLPKKALYKGRTFVLWMW